MGHGCSAWNSREFTVELSLPSPNCRTHDPCSRFASIPPHLPARAALHLPILATIRLGRMSLKRSRRKALGPPLSPRSAKTKLCNGCSLIASSRRGSSAASRPKPY